MGVDVGFDMVPRLTSGVEDRHKWKQFIDHVKVFYEDDNLVVSKANYIEFEVGEHPILPFEGHKFLRFSSKLTRGAGEYISEVTHLAHQHFGPRIERWHEGSDQFGHYDWMDVHKSIRSYDQPDQLSNAPLFEVRDIPTKGRGLFATVDIPLGTRILCEVPLLLAHPMSPDDLEIALAIKLKTLSKSQQRKFLSLHNNSPGKYPFGGIVRTNALPCGPGAAVGGVYPTICLINHSCLANSHNNWNSEEGHETIHAIRPIEAGEEITICYDQGGPSAVRKATFEKSFGFDCTCSLCTLPAPELKASDNRRLRIQQLDANIGNPVTMMNNPKSCLKACYSLLQTLREEYNGWAGALYARLYYDAFQISIAHGDVARATIFAKNSYRARIICEGEDSPATIRMKALALEPTGHSSFGAYFKKWKTEKWEGKLEGAEFEKWLFRQES
ncbi:SET domain-containing protein 5 [Fusarium austroafricanum]|uniref:SET domain-containing protein 5 n=1 Tax=Fusarium austroafricanum TaxID=2364996 RepID=A0A8H4KF52_9HYPO|nr:SET domain-containing protein 5 [Fusarium austroafricanum]